MKIPFDRILDEIDAVNFDGFYDAAMFEFERVEWHVKPKWIPWYSKTSSTVSQDCVQLHRDFLSWPIKKQTDNVLHELAHVKQYKEGKLSFWQYIFSNQLKFDVELAANYENIRYRVRCGELPKSEIEKRLRQVSPHEFNQIYYRAWDAAKEIHRENDLNFVLGLYSEYKKFALDEFNKLPD